MWITERTNLAIATKGLYFTCKMSKASRYTSDDIWKNNVEKIVSNIDTRIREFYRTINVLTE